jgi:hypothetical protein
MNANLTHDATAACGATLIENAAPGALFAKRRRRDGTCQDYDRARLVNLRAVPLRDLDALAELLARLGTRPRLCLVRAAIADPARAQCVRRLLHPAPETGEPPTLIEVPRQWVALDIDGVTLPAGIDPRDLERCARHVLALLPPAFRAARCIVQATAGHGIKPGARIRLWFWLSRPTLGAELAAWLTGFPVDAAGFRPAQPIYAAAPIFEGCADPLPRRLVMLPGAECVAVPAPALLRKPPPVPLRPARIRDSGDGAAALAWVTREIARQREGARHDTAIRIAGWLANKARHGAVPASAIANAITAGLVAAGKDAKEGEAIAAYVLRAEGLA